MLFLGRRRVCREHARMAPAIKKWSAVTVLVEQIERLRTRFV
jgi:hypothetical protein